MKKLLFMVVLAALGGLAAVLFVRRRAESDLPMEGFSGEVPLATVPPMPGMS